ncbi:hypothetical protein ACE6H2_016353 [Prunus campanulata]
MFRIKSVDDKKKNQNSGVFQCAETSSYSSARDRNPVIGNVDYYGVLKDIYELNYGGETERDDNGRKITLFNCDWVDTASDRGMKFDGYGFPLVNFNRFRQTKDTFILASQATQVFYVVDPKDGHWHVPTQTQPRGFFDVLEDSDLAPTIDNPLSATDNYAIPNLDDQLLDNEELHIRVDMDEMVDEDEPGNEDEEDVQSSDDLSTENEDELYDDMEY